MKRCSRCNAVKSPEEFYVRRKSNDGLRPDCKDCVRADQAQRYANGGRERAAEHNRRPEVAERRRQLKRSPEYQAKARANRAEKRAVDPLWFRLQQYKLTRDQFDAQWISQDGSCAICLERLTIDTVRFDHDRSCCSGAGSCGVCFRGFLCHGCNTAIGLMHECRERFGRAVEYLDQHLPATPDSKKIQ